MLNLLRFKPEADGIDEGLSGLEAYQRYGAAAAPFLARVGGRLLCGAETSQMVIGPEALEWDMALMVEYPSRRSSSRWPPIPTTSQSTRTVPRHSPTRD